MSRKKAFALRINEDMLKAIEKWAADELRSINAQIEFLLTKAVKDAGRFKQINANESANNPVPPEEN